MKKLILLLMLLMLVTSCSLFDRGQTDQWGVAQFGVSNSTLEKQAEAITPHHVQLSYLDANNQLFTEILALSLFNDSYLSTPLQLDVGSYSLEEFIVMNEVDSVIYISPKTGSDKAALVNNPLPLVFSVLKDSTTKVIPEVLAVSADDDPGDFGYTEFSFVVIGDYNAFARCLNRFGLDMFKYLAGNPLDSAANTFISPISISYATALLLSGSSGATKNILEDLTYLDAYSDIEMKSHFMGFANYLYQQSDEVEFSLAQAIWHQTGVDLYNSYINAMDYYFSSEVAPLDFAGDPYAAADTINDWASENTHGRIDEIVSGGDLMSTVIALANATYFKAPFTLGFDSCMTIPDTFYVSDGSTELCDMMNSGTVINLPYYHDDDVDVVTLPFAADSNFAMSIIMPSASIKELVENLDVSAWEKWMNGRQIEEVYLTMPKLKVEGNYSLKKTFQYLGAGDIFHAVDVSRMTNHSGLFVGNILHNTFLNVNETGAEAAAVTVILLDLGIHDNKLLKINKPFLLVLHEESTNAILFIARIDKVEQIED